MRTVPLAAAVLLLAASPLHAQHEPAAPPVTQPAEKKSLPVSAGSDGFSLQSDRRRLPTAAPRLRPVRRTLLLGRRGRARDRHVHPAPRAADPAGHAGPLLRVQRDARLRRRRHGAPGRLAGLQALAEAQGARSASSRRPSVSSACSRPLRSASSSARSRPRSSRIATSGSRSTASSRAASSPTRRASSTGRPTAAAWTAT